MNRLRRTDLGILVALLFCLLAAWPLLSRSGLPQDTDAELHIYRTAELRHLLQGGAFYPRWAPDFYFGYGYPIYNYYAPLVYYLGAALSFLPGVTVVLAVRAIFVIGLLAAGAGMFAFVRRHWGARAGLVAAAAYVYAPYIQYVDPYARGVLPEAFSLGLFPWVLLAFSAPGAPSRSGSQLCWRLPLAAGLLAALIVTHNLLALVLTTAIAGWILWQLVTSGRNRPWWLLAALMFGVALSAFFWLPVALEGDAVQLGNLVSDGGHYDFRNHFLSLRELLAPTLLLDLGATEPPYRFNIGLLQWLLALAGVLTVTLRRPRGRSPATYFALVAVLLLLLLLPVSTPIWEHVPLMPFLQFPWRLLGPLAACVAVLAGIAVAYLERAVGSLWAGRTAGAALVLLLGFGLPLTYPAPWPADFGPTDPASIIQAERRGRWLGTTSTGDFVPTSVASVPPLNDHLVESYSQPGPVDRVNRVTLPVGTTVVQTGDRPLAWTYQIAGDQYFVFRLLHFYFPGWTATLDGGPVTIEPAEPDGLMTIRVPAGSHTLTIRFDDTPPRRIAWAISAAALFLLAVGSPLAWRFTRRRAKAAPEELASVTAVSDSPANSQPPVAIGSSSGSHGRSLSPRWLLLPIVLLLFKLALADPLGWFRLRSEGLEAIPADQTVFYQVGDEIALIGYDWRPAARGESAYLTLYWKALRPPQLNYQVFVHIRDASGSVVAQSDKLNPGDFPASRWPLDRYVRDPHRLDIPLSLPPGDYRLAIGLWKMAEGERLPVSDSAGRTLGDSVFLDTITYP
jgi:hypothetical protein